MNSSNAFAAEGPLVWTQPKVFGREYQLANGDELVGWLRFEESFGSLGAVAKSIGVTSVFGNRNGLSFKEMTVSCFSSNSMTA